MLEGLSPLHLILILGIVLIVVGPRRLPELGSALGKTLREFREATTGLTDALPSTAPPATLAVPAATPVVPAATGAPETGTPETGVPGEPAARIAAAPAAEGDPAA